MANAPGGDVVEVDFHDQLRAQRDPFELLAGAPAARVRGPVLARLIRLEKADQPALLRSREPGAVTDHAQLRAVIEGEYQRPDGARLLAGSPSGHDRVDRAHALDLDHALALARA